MKSSPFLSSDLLKIKNTENLFPNLTASSKHPYDIERIPLDDPEYASETPRHLQNKEIPGFPTTVIAVGEPGSGKTNLLINLLTRKDFWNGFFDKVYYLGPTIDADASYKVLSIPHDRKVTEQEEFIPKLTEWVAEQVQAVQHDRKTAPKCLFIFEDITSYYYTAQASPEFGKCFTTIRHHKSNAYANIHKFKALNRTARQSARHIMVWPVTLSEQSQIYEDYAPKNLRKEDFFFMCSEIWKPDPSQPKPFLYINKYCKEEDRFRRCFTHIIDVNQFSGIHKRVNANPGQDPWFISDEKIDTECICQQCKCKCCRHPRKNLKKRKRGPLDERSNSNDKKRVVPKQEQQTGHSDQTIKPANFDKEKALSYSSLSSSSAKPMSSTSGGSIGQPGLEMPRLTKTIFHYNH